MKKKGGWQKGEKSLKHLIHKHWQPKGLIIEKPIAPGDTFNEDKNNPPPWRKKEHIESMNHPLAIKYGSEVSGYHLRPMFYGIHMACTLKQDYEKKHGFIYDCALRLRTDVCFYQLLQLDKYNLNVLHATHYTWEKNHDCCDFLWFANSPLMDKSCTLFTKMPKVIHAVQTKYLIHRKENQRVTGERLLGVYLKFFQGIVVKDCKLHFILFRFMQPTDYSPPKLRTKVWKLKFKRFFSRRSQHT